LSEVSCYRVVVAATTVVKLEASAKFKRSVAQTLLGWALAEAVVALGAAKFFEEVLLVVTVSELAAAARIKVVVVLLAEAAVAVKPVAARGRIAELVAASWDKAEPATALATLSALVAPRFFEEVLLVVAAFELAAAAKIKVVVLCYWQKLLLLLNLYQQQEEQ
jgi:hypothetical protein